MSFAASSAGAASRSRRVDVEPGDDLGRDRPDRPARVGQAVAPAGGQRRVAEPADQRVELAGRGRRVVDAGDQAAAAEIDVVGQTDGDRQRRERLVERPVERVDRLDPGRDARRQRDDRVARSQPATLDPPGERAVVRIADAGPG